jgi:hypothetical protein
MYLCSPVEREEKERIKGRKKSCKKIRRGEKEFVPLQPERERVNERE